ncbi:MULTISPECIES: hypothetical protein [Alteribacter]|uniref:Uncharacterized protein n=1 Tax=Alteribacter keqinensis TaxID=2483800 RepID=A0A3M7TQT0_9BACI|nr:MULTISPECIES: hypothetical protein [Alteribacter]MBM7095459.1 hypothetical protein [Alteribacter salitolerans]RNA67934.1 hypothetical protein EBO34_14660 [Alteribacter keqinensis]
MFLEHYHDLVPILISISILVALAGAQWVNYLSHDCMVRNRHMANSRIRSLQRARLDDDEAVESKEERQSFITRIVKRKEAPEDDADYFSFSLEMMNESEEDKYGENICIT